METQLDLVIKNPNYPGVGEYSTQTISVNLEDNPDFEICETVKFTVDTTEMNFEVRTKKSEVAVVLGEENTG
jgi:hypothetical protein